MSDKDEAIAAKIRDELDRRGWSQRQLADKAMLGEATVFRLLKGDFSRKSLLKVQEVLGRSFDNAQSEPVRVADLAYGAYARDLYDYYEGDYICLRAAFADPDKLVVYEMEIFWCNETRALVFVDRTPGYEQRGTIHVPTGTQFLHFITLDNGSARLITAYHMPPKGTYMRAMLMTFANPKGRELYPAASPLLMFRRDADPDLAELKPGLCERLHPDLRNVLPVFEQIECAPLLLKEE